MMIMMMMMVMMMMTMIMMMVTTIMMMMKSKFDFVWTKQHHACSLQCYFIVFIWMITGCSVLPTFLKRLKTGANLQSRAYLRVPLSQIYCLIAFICMASQLTGILHNKRLESENHDKICFKRKTTSQGLFQIVLYLDNWLTVRRFCVPE